MTFQQLKDLYFTNYHGTDDQAAVAWEEIIELLPIQVAQALDGPDPDGDEFKRVLTAYLGGRLAIKPTDHAAAATTRTSSPATKPKKKRGLFNQPRRVSKAVETWRCLSN